MQRRRSPLRKRNNEGGGADDEWLPTSATATRSSSNNVARGGIHHEQEEEVPRVRRMKGKSARNSFSSKLFWCAMCCLSFFSALFVLGLVHILLLQQQHSHHDVTNESYIRHQMKKQRHQRNKQQLHRLGENGPDDSLGGSRLNGGLSKMGPDVQDPQSPQMVKRARAFEEEAAFGYDERGGERHLASGEEQHEEDYSREGASLHGTDGEAYDKVVEARLQARNERIRAYDEQRQKERTRIRRSPAAKRVAGSVLFDSAERAPKPPSWSELVRNIVGWNKAGDQDESVYDTADLPVADYLEHYGDLVRAWEREGMFYNYSLPAIPNEHTLPRPEARSAKLVVIIMSTRDQIELRQVIRETWGRGHVIYFVVGGHDGEAPLEADLHAEAKANGDILDTIHPESYRSLPYKLRYAYQWVTREMFDAEWILKVDDDMVARIDTLETVILNKLNSRNPVVMGKIVPHAKVSRTGKWAEFLYLERYYPFWPKGSHGHVVSRPVAEYVVGMTNFTYYQGEDTSLGIWLSQSPLHITWISSLYFQNHGRCEEDEWIVVGHQVGAEHMRECFDKLDEWEEEGMEDKQRNLWFMETRAQRKWISDMREDSRHEPMVGR